MRTNTIRNALLKRRLTIGSWIQTGSPAAAEILANAGFDWLGIDCEHTSIDVAGVEEICRATHGRGPAMLVRVRACDTLAIRQALDVGAHGVIVPLVHNAELAAKAVRAAKYPPRGVRGHAFCRTNNWGVDFGANARTANDRSAVVVMIESREGVENIDAILAVEGVDGVFIGPYDLSASCGVPGQTRHPLVRQAIARVLAACQRAGKSAGQHLIFPTRAEIGAAIRTGFTFVCLDGDTILLNSAARGILDVARQAAACRPREPHSR